MSSQSENEIIDINEIMGMIPHRYPFLLVDKIVEFEPGERAIGLKNVTMNEPHFMGHFPGAPIMPGVLIVEALAQTAGLVVIKSMTETAKDKMVYFMTIDNARFRKPVVPGDHLYLHVEKIQSRGSVWKFKGYGKVGDKICAEAVFSAMIADKDKEL